MKILHDTATDLPGWVRGVLAGFAAGFVALGWWLASLLREGGWPVGLVAGFSFLVAVLLVFSSARGRIWRWMWIYPTSVPPGPGP